MGQETLERLAGALCGGAVFSPETLDGIAGILRDPTWASLSEKDLARAIKFVEENESTNAKMQLSLTVLGDPSASKRPRFARMKNKEGKVIGVKTYAPDAEDQHDIRSDVRRALPAGHAPFAGEVEVSLEIYRKMLASWPPYKCLLAEIGYIRPETKPDFDNYTKLVLDAMRGVVYVDDSLVVVGNISLYYSARPRTEITLVGRQRRLSK
jgi:Holliday junction resolvase RusA-like endonuclease